MKKILLGFIAIGLLTFVGCKKPTDINGNTYKSVRIGEQVWMSENLRTTKYNDGTVIPNITGDAEWEALSTGAWCHYENGNQYENTYGKLYNWYAVETGKLCPTGWHVPTDEEWTDLTDYLAANGYDGKEGTALKATSGWDSDGNGTDDYGWNGLPGGRRSDGGNFFFFGGLGSLWSSSEGGIYDVWIRNFSSSSDNLWRDSEYEGSGLSVRCLRD